MSRARILAACVLASAALGACDGGGGASVSRPTSQSVESPTAEAEHLPPRQALTRAIARIDGRGTYDQSVVTSSGTAVWSVVGEYELRRGAARMRIFHAEEFHPDTSRFDYLTALDGRGFVPGAAYGADVDECWLEVIPDVMADLVGRGEPHRLGLAPIDLLSMMTVTGEDRVAQLILATLPIRFAVTLFGPDISQLLAGDPMEGSVPVKITVVDGRVLDWGIEGTDLAHAVRAAGADAKDARRLERLEFEVGLFSGRDEFKSVELPPAEEITRDPDVPCAAEGVAA